MSLGLRVGSCEEKHAEVFCSLYVLGRGEQF